MTEVQVLLRALAEAFQQLDMARARLAEVTAERDELIVRLEGVDHAEP